MEETAYKIKLPHFEGPMDLLLHLIREHKVDIYDIPISLITRQYLEHLELMKEFNLEVAGEFLLMAATLIHIKSRMLLPVEDTADTEEPEDPRLELVMRLLEYKAFKEAAHGLKELEEDHSEIFTRSPLDIEINEEEEEPEALSLFDLNLFDLITAFQKMIERAPAEALTLTKETLTVKEKMSIIIESLQTRDAMRFKELFKDDIIKSHFVVTFVAMLELIRLGIAKVYQEGQFGEIWIINPESDDSKEDIIRKNIPDGTEKPLQEVQAIEDGDRSEPEVPPVHPYDEPYEFEEGHPYKKIKPYLKSRQYEDSHPYGSSALQESDTPVDDTPVDDTPVDDTPVDDTPVDDTPVDDTPVDDTPVDDTPVDDTPVDDTPVDDTPVDDTPVDDTPEEDLQNTDD